MRHVPHKHHVACVHLQHVDKTQRVVRLHPSCGGELRQWIARAPVGVGCLPRSELAAVPDDVRAHSVRRRLTRHRVYLVTTVV